MGDTIARGMALKGYNKPNPQHPIIKYPMNLSPSLTPSVSPYDRLDGLSAITGWDNSWVVAGEDGQIHVINKDELSTIRADREPNWGQVNPWTVEMSSKVVDCDLATYDSRNTWFRGIAKESWTYVKTITKTTGYAIIVGSGDATYTGSGIFRTPTVFFYREGASAAQSLTKKLDEAGIMGEDRTTPRNLNGVIRTAEDEFFICGAGQNASTSGITSRATFGKIVLTLNSAKSETGATAVTSLTWTDYLSVLQALVPEGETIVNVVTMGGQITNVFYVIVVTKDGSNVKRSRLLTFDRDANTGALIDAKDIVLNTSIFPQINTMTYDDIQNASIIKSTAGIIFTHMMGSNNFMAFYKADTENDTQWHNIVLQIKRGLGKDGCFPREISWDSVGNQFIVAGNAGNTACLAGVLDADCKQGRPLTEVFPTPLRWAQDISASLFNCYSDNKGTLFCGSRQMLIFIPHGSLEPKPARILWGLRVTPTSNINEVAISEGEVEWYSAGGAKSRTYYAGGTFNGLTNGSATAPKTLVIKKADNTVGLTGNGWKSGTTYPEPAMLDHIILATIARSPGSVVAPSEIDQTTFRDM